MILSFGEAVQIKAFHFPHMTQIKVDLQVSSSGLAPWERAKASLRWVCFCYYALVSGWVLRCKWTYADAPSTSVDTLVTETACKEVSCKLFLTIHHDRSSTATFWMKCTEGEAKNEEFTCWLSTCVITKNG